LIRLLDRDGATQPSKRRSVVWRARRIPPRP